MVQLELDKERLVTENQYLLQQLKQAQLKLAQYTPGTGAAMHPIDTGGYYALVIGISLYEKNWDHLPTAEPDAAAVAQMLKSRYGFEVKLLSNGEATKTAILRTLDSYEKRLQPDDNLLIYYAGHGNRELDKSFWLPIDADPEYRDTWIMADELTARLKVQHARHILVVSDSCYAGGMRSGDKVGDILAPGNDSVSSDQKTQFLNKMLKSKSRHLMASGNLEPVADAGSGGHSVFAAAFLRGLQRDDFGPYFTAGDLFSAAISHQVGGSADQTPQYVPIQNSGDSETDEIGDFIFTRKPVTSLPTQPSIQ